MYFHDDLLTSSFVGLNSRTGKGKRPMERTSALFYFLSFDATVKKCGASPIDLDPHSQDGEKHRDWMQFEFERLVQLHDSVTGKPRQVTTLGEISVGGEAPARRLSSNFLTVPLKKASQSVEQYVYPRRPAPLISLGLALTGLTWGATHHPNWRSNLPALLSDFKSSSPFTDLAIFVFRDASFGEHAGELKAVLADCLRLRFSRDLADFWIDKVASERVFFKRPIPHFQAELPSAFFDHDDGTSNQISEYDVLKSCGQRALINRIVYLEQLLERHNIRFEKYN